MFPLESGRRWGLYFAGYILGLFGHSMAVIFLPDPWMGSLYVLLSLGIGVALLTAWWRQKESGFLILDLGHRRHYWGIIVLSAIFFLLAAMGAYARFFRVADYTFKGISQLCALCSVSAFLLVWALGRLEIREKGIRMPLNRLIQWDEIEAYGWDQDVLAGPVFAIRLKRRRFLERTLVWPSDPAHKATMEPVLARYLPPGNHA